MRIDTSIYATINFGLREYLFIFYCSSSCIFTCEQKLYAWEYTWPSLGPDLTKPDIENPGPGQASGLEFRPKPSPLV